MIDIDSLLNKIDIVDYISSYVELKPEGDEYFGLCPFHKENTESFSITKSKQLYFCFGCGASGNIINFIKNYHNVDFKKALQIICEYLGEDIDNLPTRLSATTYIKKFQLLDKYEDTFFVPIKFKKDVMEQYEKSQIIEWIEEGLDSNLIDKYQVRYNRADNRIVFPIFDHEGNIISISGRTLDPNWKEKKIRKYTYYSSISKLYFFIGYFHNQNIIHEKNEVIIFEGLKSVIKSEGYDYPNCIASLTSRLSPDQIKELIKMPIENVIIAWDKNVTLKEVKERVGILTKYKNIYVIIDRWNLLGEKDSPVDKGKNAWIKLYENRVKLR